MLILVLLLLELGGCSEPIPGDPSSYALYLNPTTAYLVAKGAFQPQIPSPVSTQAVARQWPGFVDPSMPPAPPPPYLVAIKQRCQRQPGNADLCVVAAMQRRVHCLTLQEFALGRMTGLQNGMKQLHATAAQLVEADIAGFNDYNPVAGPYWDPQPNAISYEETREITQWAVAVADRAAPKEFAGWVFDRCDAEATPH